MKKFLKKSLVYLIMTMLVVPATLITGALSAQKAEAASAPIISDYKLNGIATLTSAYLSPNGGGTNDDAKVNLKFRFPVTSYKIEILTEVGTLVDEIGSGNSVADPQEKVWSGKDSEGITYADGSYRIKVSVSYVEDSQFETTIDTSRTLIVDNTNPLGQIVSPIDGQYLRGNNLISVQAGDITSGISRVDFYQGISPIGWVTAPDVTGKYSKNWFTNNTMADGVYELSAVLTDGAGNQVTTETVSINVDNTSPVISSIDDIVASEEFSVTIEASDINPITYHLSQGYGPGNLTFIQDENNPATFKIKANVNSSDYGIYATATDASGNYATTNFGLTWTAQYNITAENPTLEIDTAAGDGDIIVDPATANPVLDLHNFMGTRVLEDGQEEEGVVLQDLTLKIKSLVNNIPVTLEMGFRSPETDDSQVFITGPEGWDGKINLPRITSITDAELATGSGYSASDILAIEVGLLDGELKFEGPVKLTLGNQAGKRVGYIGDGKFIEILQICGSSDETLPSEKLSCKEVSDDGKDIVIWTNHFTKYTSYSQIVKSPIITSVTAVARDNNNYLKVVWSGAAADSYEFYVNGILVQPTNLSLNSADLRVSSDGIYTVKMKAKIALDISAFSNEVSATIQAPVVITPAVTPENTVSLTPAPAKAKAAVQPAPAPEQKVETPKDDQGIIKGEEKKDDKDETNWTPWIILFILILFAGAATGGYFYWFAGKEDDREGENKPSKTENKSDTKVTVKTKTSVSKKKSKRW